MADVIESTAEEHKPGSPRKAPGFRRLTAALVGGVIGAAIALAVGFLVLPDYVQGRIDQGLASLQTDSQLEQRVAATEQQLQPFAGLRDTTGELADKLNSVQADLSALSGKVDETAQRLASVDLSNLETGQEQLAQRIQTLEEKPEPQMPDLGPLQAAVDAATRNAEDVRSFATQLGSRVDDMTSVHDATSRRVDTLTAAQAEIERRLNERTQQLADRLAANDTAMSARFASLAQLEATIAALQSAVASQSSQLGAAEATAAEAAAKAAAAVESAKAGVAAVQEQVTRQLDQDERGVATAVALTDVNQALENGAAFPAAQAVLESSAGDDPALARAAELLRTSAPRGVATREQLLAELGQLDEGGTTASSGDWVEQTRANIMGLVQVKRRDGAPAATQGGGEGNDAASQLAAGDLAGAIATVSARPDAEREPVAAWLDRAKARADAEAAAEILRQHLGELLVRPS
ncbi:MAG TPA: hypothetical protein VHL31_11695 [Geminicoccus sp.]|jgi:hypothetical protein|uniref:hypothetical protein n=1 Tax=Geminicoccus sp. TaxID=2024832 RepID=UPI002E33F8C8|nr:hypothetical protein [Geminicoccus sp.]HEX2526942.1 hypothetical protein [Geminicoccus sp.]